VLIIVAMEAEAAPLVAELGLQQDSPSRIPPPATCVTFSGRVKGLSVHIAVNGVCKDYGVDNVGSVPATLTSYLAIQEFKPDIVISAGTAGGFQSQGGSIGDVYHSTSTINHDRVISIPAFTAYGYDSRSSLPCPKMVEALGFKEGIVSTGNMFDKSPEDMKVMSENNAAVKEMEAAAIAWVCSLSDTPFFALKAITDIVDGEKPSDEEFLENLHQAAVQLKAAVVGAVGFMDGKTLAEL